MTGVRGLGQRWSLRSQLVAALVVLLLVALVATGVATALVLRTYLLDRTDEQLLAAARPFQLVQQCRPRRGPGGPPELPSSFTVALLDAQGGQVRVCRNPLQDEDEAAVPVVTAERTRAEAGQPFDAGDGLRAVAYPIRLGPGQRGAQGSLVVATPTADVSTTVREVLRSELLLGLVALAGVGLLGWLAVTRSLRPLRRIEDTAEAIAAGDLGQRVPEPASTTTEVGRLSRALNGMLAQIERAFRVRASSEARMRRFVGDASHELRTPLTSIRGFAELYRQGAVREPDDVARAMGRIEDEAVRMQGLVEDLLLLARLDEERPVARVPVDLDAVVADGVADARAVDPDREVTVVRPAGSAPPGGRLLVLGDEARLRQVLGNLLTNALRHTPAGTPVEVRAGVAAGAPGAVAGGAPGVPAGPVARLEVADRGPGLTAEQAERVFDRFYRTDAGRSRDVGGSGLGLSIVAALVEAQGGRVGVVPRGRVGVVPRGRVGVVPRGRVGVVPSGPGAVFWVELPLAPDGSGRPAGSGAAPDSQAVPRSVAPGPQAERPA